VIVTYGKLKGSLQIAQPGVPWLVGWPCRGTTCDDSALAYLLWTNVCNGFNVGICGLSQVKRPYFQWHSTQSHLFTVVF
jgi:hypothetical protein